MATDLEAARADRLVRLALLAVIAILAMAIAIERTRTDCFPATLSQYANTAVRPAVTVGFAAMGICLALVRHEVRSHQHVMTAASAMAAVVAVAPARARDAGCTSIPLPELAAFNTVRVQTAAAVLIVAVVVAAVLASGSLRPELLRRLVRTFAVVVAPAVVLSMIVRVVTSSQTAEIITRVHDIAAGGLFVLLIVATHQRASAAGGRYRRAYRCCSVALVFICVGAVVGNMADEWFIADGWRHPTLVAQMVGLGVVSGFWAIETAEHWGE